MVLGDAVSGSALAHFQQHNDQDHVFGGWALAVSCACAVGKSRSIHQPILCAVKDRTVRLQLWDTAGQERFRTGSSDDCWKKLRDLHLAFVSACDEEPHSELHSRLIRCYRLLSCVHFDIVTLMSCTLQVHMWAGHL
eukprot:1738648-Amphidinium_carterae.1